MALHRGANAATVIHSLTGPAATQNPSGSISVPQFDSTLGVLESVSLLVTVNTSALSYNISVTNGTLNPTWSGYAFITDKTNVSFTGPGGLSATGIVDVGSVSQTWSNLSSPVNVSGTHNANSGDFSSVLTSGLTSYLGTGTLNIIWGLTNAHTHSTQSNTTTYTQTSPNPNTIPFTTTYGSTSGYTGSLIYTYTAVPEPSRAMLVMLGLASVAARRRRLKA
ncbi:PEP-CTERM sorting domain-containing protein [Brevifollis gellanilyticus]|uniref:PEP-CTERM protein-sorting domain-containing protein n=1 Tax=Brevifollis gellanilyticus TaxID=748831 RepID=A0A512MG22_9BACT|nr:PEP-CTERM sorting domain-containing protein [Brevifollis gellanilyticus]GEP45678.1 hypothetical protein BGE01nite_49690 [Brevifollis gellanilyticus]